MGTLALPKASPGAFNCTTSGIVIYLLHDTDQRIDGEITCVDVVMFVCSLLTNV